MTGFKPQTSAIRDNYSANWATTTDLGQIKFIFNFMFIFIIKKTNNRINKKITNKQRWCAWDSNPGPLETKDGRRRWIHWAMACPKIHLRLCWVILSNAVVSVYLLQLKSWMWKPHFESTPTYLLWQNMPASKLARDKTKKKDFDVLWKNFWIKFSRCEIISFSGHRWNIKRIKNLFCWN